MDGGEGDMAFYCMKCSESMSLPSSRQSKTFNCPSIAIEMLRCQVK